MNLNPICLGGRRAPLHTFPLGSRSAGRSVPIGGLRFATSKFKLNPVESSRPQASSLLLTNAALVYWVVVSIHLQRGLRGVTPNLGPTCPNGQRALTASHFGYRFSERSKASQQLMGPRIRHWFIGRQCCFIYRTRVLI